ncbi:MAG: ABC transporter permease [Candidatus Hermodarchaeota archaeon]
MFSSRDHVQNFYINIAITIGIGGTIFFIGTIISFNVFLFLPGDPVYALLEAMGITDPLPDLVAAYRDQLGFDLPIFLRYFRYLGDIFTGDWGVSVSVARQTPVRELIATRFPRTIDLMMVSSIISVGCGIILGKYLAKNRGSIQDKIVQLANIIGISLPIFFLGMLFQYYLAFQFPIFPGTYYKNIDFEDPPFVTGFYIIDAFLSGQFYKIPDYIYHLILPVTCLTIISFSLVTIITRSYMLNQSRDKSVMSNSVVTGFLFGFMFMFTMLVETTFGLNGFGSLLVSAINLIDFWLISASLNILIIMFVIITLISNFGYSLHKFLKAREFGYRIEPKLEEDM